MKPLRNGNFVIVAFAAAAFGQYAHMGGFSLFWIFCFVQSRLLSIKSTFVKYVFI
jgi:hypothetical protein